MHFDEGAEFLDFFAHRATRRGIGRDGRTDGDAAILGDLGRDIADAANVEVAVFLREAELRREVLTHDIAIKQRHRTPAHFHEFHHESVGDGRFSRPGEPGEEHGKALF